MGNCMSNSGNFEPPGAKSVSAFKAQQERENDPRWQALRAAQIRAERAEKAAAEAPPKVPVKLKGPKCSICRSYVTVSVNPWQRTRGDLLAAELSDDSDAEEADEEAAAAAVDAAGPAARGKRPTKVDKHGIELNHCKHVFCGACLAQSIYRNLNVPFDPSSYGTKIPATPVDALGGKTEFPMGCPTCQVKPGEQMVEISDMTARLVLGDCNTEEWQHARFVSTLDIIYCPHKGCNEPFDANDVAPAPEGVSHEASLVQCPRCKKSLCRTCKVAWHDKLTCEEYQAIPIDERAPEDIALAELAKKERWRRCPKCGAMVELKYGCNHITCKCKHHFCYMCGADFEYKNGKYHCTGGKACKLWDEDALLERP